MSIENKDNTLIKELEEIQAECRPIESMTISRVIGILATHKLDESWTEKEYLEDLEEIKRQVEAEERLDLIPLTIPISLGMAKLARNEIKSLLDHSDNYSNVGLLEIESLLQTAIEQEGE